MMSSRGSSPIRRQNSVRSPGARPHQRFLWKAIRLAAPLPVLYRRGSTYYFKRKIPTDCAEAFPQCQGAL